MINRNSQLTVSGSILFYEFIDSITERNQYNYKKTTATKLFNWLKVKKQDLTKYEYDRFLIHLEWNEIRVYGKNVIGKLTF